MKNAKNVMLSSLLVVVLVFAPGCGLLHGVCEDGKTVFTGLSNITRPLAEKGEDIQRQWEESSQYARQKRAEEILRYQQKKDQATAEAYKKAFSGR